MNIKFGVEQTTTQRFEWIYEVADGLSADEIEKAIAADIKKYRGGLSAGDVPYSIIGLSNRKNVKTKCLDILEDVENTNLEFDTFEITVNNNFDDEYPDDEDDRINDEDWED